MSNLDFIIAKVRGIRSKLYEGDRLLRLCDVPDAAELAAQLAPGQPIGDTIALQRHLTAKHVAALHGILSHLDGWDAELFLWLLRRYQVENLKLLVRSWATKTGEPLLERLTVQVPKALDLPAKELMRADSLATLIKALPVRQLRDGARLGLKAFEETGRPFFVEAGIDKAYFTELKRLAELADSESRPGVQKLVRLELDIYNAMLILRSRFNYSIAFDKIRPFLAPAGTMGVLGIEELRNAPDLDSAAALIPRAVLGPQAQPPSGADAEPAMWDNLYRTANHQFYTCVLDFGAVVAFYYIKRVELANLIRISECIRYGERGDAVRRKLMTLPATQPAGAL